VTVAEESAGRSIGGARREPHDRVRILVRGLGRGGGHAVRVICFADGPAGLAQKLTDALLERGLYTRVALDCICLAPPLVTSDALLDRIVDTIREAIPPALDAVRKEPAVRGARA